MKTPQVPAIPGMTPLGLKPAKKFKRVRPELYDLCKVIQAGGGLAPTLYLVEYIDSVKPTRCIIREAGKPLAGGQEFDLSLLQKVDRDEVSR